MDLTEADAGEALLRPQWCTTEEPLHVISILKAYRDLGFHPSHGLLTAAEPFLSGLQHPIPLQQALDLITLFRAFSWQPGQSRSTVGKLLLPELSCLVLDCIALSDESLTCHSSLLSLHQHLHIVIVS